MKTKYAAHLIMAVRFREGVQDRFPCFENVVVVDAETDDDAMQAALACGEQEAAATEFDWDGRPAIWQFVGVRKLIECRTLGSLENRLEPGTEVTYSQFVLSSEDDLRKLADGESVPLTYEE